MAHQVFLCFSPVDRQLAEEALETLEQNGVSCYFSPRDTTTGGDVAKESLAAISTAKVTVFLFTDDANMDSAVAREMDAASKAGAEPVTLRLSNSMPLGRLGFYMTIPYTIDAREGDPESHFDALLTLTKETISLVEENRAKTLERWEQRPGEEKKKIFEMPGVRSSRWYVSLLSVVFFVFAAVLLATTYLALSRSETFAPDLIAAITLTLLILVPTLILGNLLGIRDKLPLFKSRRPMPTIAGLLLVEAIIFFLFDFILSLISR